MKIKKFILTFVILMACVFALAACTNEVVVDSITIVGESVVLKDSDLGELKINATMSDATSDEIVVTESMISGFDKAKVGKQEVTVTYGGFTAKFNVLVVNNIIGTVDEFETALAGQADDQVWAVKEGKYPIQLNITSDVAIYGSDKDKVIISGTEDYSTMTSINAIAGEKLNYSGIININNATAILENLTIAGDVDKASAASNITHTNRYLGIAVISSTLTANNITVKDITYNNDLKGMQNGIAVYAVSANADTNVVTITNSILENFNKGAAVIRASIKQFNFENNIVKGFGAQALISQNGVQVSTKSVIKNNSFTGLQYRPDQTNESTNGSVAIYLVDVDDALCIISGNTFTDIDIEIQK